MPIGAKAYQKAILRPYFKVRTWWPIWFYALNHSARISFRRSKPALSPLQARIVRDLRNDGIGITTLAELFPGEDMLHKLQVWEKAHSPVEDTSGKKKFLREYWDLICELDFSNPFLELSLREAIIDIVETYMEMWVRLKQYHLGKTLPNPSPSLSGSQHWHRDPEEKRMCKMFVYINDVDESAGPFTYLPKSTYGLRYGNLFPQKTPEGSYPPGNAIYAAAGNEVQPVTGRAGTVIFCDTSGLHFGGRAISSERIMFTAAYASPLYSEGSRFYLKTLEQSENLPPKQRFLISGKHLTVRNSTQAQMP